MLAAWHPVEADAGPGMSGQSPPREGCTPSAGLCTAGSADTGGSMGARRMQGSSDAAPAAAAACVPNPFSNQAAGPDWWEGSGAQREAPAGPTTLFGGGMGPFRRSFDVSQPQRSSSSAPAAAAAGAVVPAAPREPVRFAAAEEEPAGGPATLQQHGPAALPGAAAAGICTDGPSRAGSEGSAEQGSWTEAAAAASVGATCAPLTRHNSSESEEAGVAPEQHAAHAPPISRQGSRDDGAEAGPAPSLQAWGPGHKLGSQQSASSGAAGMTRPHAPRAADVRCGTRCFLQTGDARVYNTPARGLSSVRAWQCSAVHAGVAERGVVLGSLQHRARRSGVCCSAPAQPARRFCRAARRCCRAARWCRGRSGGRLCAQRAAERGGSQHERRGRQHSGRQVRHRRACSQTRHRLARRQARPRCSAQ